MCNRRIKAPEPVWELRARSYRVITNTEVVRSRHAELVMLSRLVGSDLRAWHRFWTDYGALGALGSDPTNAPILDFR
jgi:hypothetical protein